MFFFSYCVKKWWWLFVIDIFTLLDPIYPFDSPIEWSKWGALTMLFPEVRAIIWHLIKTYCFCLNWASLNSATNQLTMQKFSGFEGKIGYTPSINQIIDIHILSELMIQKFFLTRSSFPVPSCRRWQICLESLFCLFLGDFLGKIWCFFGPWRSRKIFDVTFVIFFAGDNPFVGNTENEYQYFVLPTFQPLPSKPGSFLFDFFFETPYF